MQRYTFDIWDGHRQSDRIVTLLPNDDDALAHAAEIAIMHVVELDGLARQMPWRMIVKNAHGAILRTIELGTRQRPLRSHFTVQ